MTTTNDVGVLVYELIPLLQTLEELIAEQVTDPSRGTTSHHKVSGSPAPWHPEAGMVLLTIHEEARRLEASLRRQVSGRLGARRGGSQANTTAALKAIIRLVHGVDDASAGAARHIIERWVRSARQITDIGLDERWVPVPATPGQLPPKCPYCRTYALRVALRAGLIRCINRSCEDNNGDQPFGRLDRSQLNGDPMVTWADGRTIVYGRGWA